jgi:hypothetical protein
MIVILGLVILAVAAIAGVDAVLGNGGHGHALTNGFSMLGYHVTGSTGTLFLYGIVVGAVAMLGLGLLLGGARRTSRRGSAARRGLRQSRRETATVGRDRDDLLSQRETARADAASTLGDGAADSSPVSPDAQQAAVPQQVPAAQPADPAAQPTADVPAEEPASAQ